MPKLAHNFVQGKMNKDLDERLVPPGQYRDALNIQVSTSEGSDVGAVENILGNTKLNKKSSSVNWAANFGLTSAQCIGAARDTQNNKLYWFVTSASVDAILEYDEATGFVAPVIVDVRAASKLNFSSNHYITGVNIFEGLLAWTDNHNEPRIINIETFKAGSSQTGTALATTTSVYSVLFDESHINVIKLKPDNAPSITMASTSRAGSTTGLGLNKVTCNKNFTELYNGNRVPLEVGSSQTFAASAAPNWIVGDVITLATNETDDNDVENEYQVRIKITGVSGTAITGTIQSISSNLKSVTYTWTCTLDEEKPMFELEFPRFAYRWKYTDNRYSAFSPWSQVAFLPADFKYTFKEAYNLGMSNNLRKLTLGNFDTPPEDVEQVEILYKDSSENIIYKVDEVVDTVSSYSITSELIYHAINSNQSIRPYDNVPRKALAQEVIGNRLVYGNYLQNYTVPGFLTNISLALSSSNITSLKTPEESIKSLRTYQAGIVFLDDMGRETPVFTNSTASITVDKNISHKVNKIKADFDLGDNALSALSDKFSHFKYYVKDISTEYYNIVLDRYYASEDGNLWLSFPSAERNKVKEGSFLNLKKKHSSDSSVEGPAKYKVLDISNEAPQFLKESRLQIAVDSINKGSTDAVAVGKKSFQFIGPADDASNKFRESFESGNFIRFNNGGVVSDYYEIASGGYTGESLTYEVELKERIDSKDSAVFPSSTSTKFLCEIYQIKTINAAEFQGRFFVKINRDVVFEENIIYNFTNNAGDYEKDPNTELLVVSDNVTDNPDSDIDGGGVTAFGWDENANAADPSVTVHGKPSANSKLLGFYFAPFDNTENPIFNTETAAKKFNDNIAAGTVLQFRDAVSDTYSKPYEVASVVKGEYDRQSGTVGSANDEKGYYWNITLTENFQEENWDAEVVRISKRKRILLNEFDQNSQSLSSNNPAIFETEPLETADLNLYYEACDAQQIANLEVEIELPYFNCFSFGNGVESDRIRDDFNAKTITKGVKVSTTLDEPYTEERRSAGLIYSGIFNSTSGVNELNQFIAGLKITKDLNPIYGSIQKLHARDTDLIALLEDKCFRILANKDALFNADGNTNITSTNNVLGQAIPYAGEFGISKNPESFASYGFRAYFTDKSRGAVLRLSKDGLTEISEGGMSDYFEDKLKSASGSILGSYDEAGGSYNVSFNNDESVAFKEGVGGWSSRMTFVPESAISLNNEYYTIKAGELWVHNSATRANFYGAQAFSTITPIFNDAPSSIKNFKTLSYEGDAGWVADVLTDQQDGEVEAWKKKENFYFNYIKGKATTLANIDTGEFSVQGLGNVLTHPADKVIIINGEINASLQIGDVIYSTAGVTSPAVLRVIGTVATISMPNQITLASSIPSPAPATGNFMLFAKDSEKNTSGVIGYHASVEMKTTSSDKKELFAVNSEVFISSE